jgi:hypothetical protein
MLAPREGYHLGHEPRQGMDAAAVWGIGCSSSRPGRRRPRASGARRRRRIRPARRPLASVRRSCGPEPGERARRACHHTCRWRGAARGAGGSAGGRRRCGGRWRKARSPRPRGRPRTAGGDRTGGNERAREWLERHRFARNRNRKRCRRTAVRRLGFWSDARRQGRRRGHLCDLAAAGRAWRDRHGRAPVGWERTQFDSSPWDIVGRHGHAEQGPAGRRPSVRRI